VVRSALSAVVAERWGQRASSRAQVWLRRAALPGGAPLLLLAFLPALLWRGKTTPLTVGLFAIGVTAFFLLPGYAIVRALRLRCSGEDRLVVSLGIGLVTSNVGFAVVSYASAPALYWLLPLGTVAYLVRQQRSFTAQAPRPKAALATNLLACGVVAIPAFALTQFPVHALDYVRDGAGAHLVAWADGALHVSIANELTHTFPPRNPFVGDQLLVYHYATELSAAVFCKFLGLPATTVCLRLLPTFFISLAALSFFALLKRLTGSLPAALITPLLLLLGEDFSYFPGLWQGSAGLWAAEYFSSPCIFGLYFSNPNLPALAAFGCSMVAFSHAFRGDRTCHRWLVVAAVTLALAGSYKIFFGLQSLAALGLCVLVCRGQQRKFALELLLVTAVALALLLSPTLSSHAQGKIIELVPTFFTGYISGALGRLQLADTALLRPVATMFAQKQVTSAGAASWLFVAVPLFVVGTLGIRLLGLPRLLRALAARTACGAPLLPFLAWFVVCGYVLGLGLRVTPLDYPHEYNNSVWFIVESKLVSWIFVGLMLGNVFKSWSPRQAAWTAALQMLLLAAPATVNTFTVLSRNAAPTLATPDESRIAEHFELHVPPGAIVLCESSSLRRLLLGEARARVPLAPEFYLTSFLRRTDLDRRTQDVAEFWRAWGTGQFRADLAKAYHVDYVVSARALPDRSPTFKTSTLYVYPVSQL
jgi:hypothetical protein